MNSRNILRNIPLSAPLAIGVAMLIGATPALSQGRYYGKSHDQRDVNRINKIINGLEPRRHHSHGYNRKVRKIVTWRKGRKLRHSYYVNFNHTVDLSVYFAFNSSRIAPEAIPVLNDLGRALLSPRLRHARYLIAGHTDAQGARGYNQWLSEARAFAVVDYLVNEFGIAPYRLVALGFGEERPVDPYDPYSARNRRVEVSLIENDRAYIPRDAETYELRKYEFTPLRKGGVR